MKKLLFLTSLILLLTSCNSDNNCLDTNCDDYYSQSDAQLAYDLDPDCHGDLDADNDGMACEDWATYYNNLNQGNNSGGGNSGCPTTANCGCSNKTKAQCEADPCCQWIVGDGCKCA